MIKPLTQNRKFNPLLFEKLSAAVGCGFLILLLGTILCIFDLISIPIERTLQAAAISQERGYASTVIIGVQPKTVLGQELHVRLFENGKLLGPIDSPHDEIRGKGQGRFSHWDRTIYFSSSDNSSPKTNGRIYAIKLNKPITPLVFLLCCLVPVILNYPRLKRCHIVFANLHPAYPAAVLAILTAAFRLWVWNTHPSLTYGGHIVQGVPFSDGRGWDSFSRDFAAGNLNLGGWDARRPFTYIFFGSLYALTGAYTKYTFFFNYLGSIISAVVIFDALRRVMPAYLAFITSACHAFSMTSALESMTTGSEPLGYLFSNLSIWLLVLGCEGSARHREAAPRSSLIWMLLAGALLGLANLTRTLTLLAIGVLPILVFLVFSRSWISLPKIGNSVLKLCFMFIFGFGLVVGPWIVRQEVKYGIGSISDNSSEMLYAASSPEYISWSSRVSNLFKGNGLRDRFKFFSDGFKENLRKYPGFYISNAQGYAWQATKELQVPGWAILVTCAACLVCPSRRRGLWKYSGLAIALSAIILTLPVFTQVWTSSLVWLWLVGAALAFVLRDQALLILGVVLASVAALGLCAFSGDRVTFSLQWCATALGLWLIHTLASRPGPIDVAWRGEYRSFAPVWGGSWIRWTSRISLIMVAVLLIGCGVALFRMYEYKPAPGLTAEQSASYIARTLADPKCQTIRDLAPVLETRIGAVRPDYSVHLAENQYIDHWAEFFMARSYPRTLFEVYPESPEVYLMLPGPGTLLGENEQIVAVGVPLWLPGLKTLETVNLFVLNPDGSIKSELHCADPVSIERHHQQIKQLINLPENSGIMQKLVAK